MFTFILPCYENNAFLKATLTSLMWQKELGHDFEVIIVDNNSMREDPNQIYREFFDRLKVFLVKQPKLLHPFAPSRARNIAIRLAKHDWIISLDADIVLNKDYLTHLTNIVKNNNNLMIVSERIFLDGSKVSMIEQEGLSWPEQQPRIASASNYGLLEDRRLPLMKNIASSPHPWAFMHGCNMIFPRQKALEVGGYDEAYDGHWGYEDVDFAYRLIAQKNVEPFYGEGLFCYHLEIPQLNRQVERFNKCENPNWQRICEKIPGFKEYKEVEYQHISQLIKT